MALTLVTSDLIGGLDYSKLTGTVPTWNQNTTGSAATLTTARNIGGVSFNGSAAINLPGVNAAGNQNTSGNAGTVTNGVYTVGNQTIGGTKTFSSATTFQLSALTNPSGVDANTVLTIKNNGWSGITMLSSAAAGSFLTFGDADAGFRGRIQYLQGSTDAMVFETAASEKMRISSGGDVTIGSSNDPYLYMVSSGGNGYNSRFRMYGYADGGTYGGGFKIDTRNSSNVFNNALTISSGGNMTLASGLSLFTQGPGRVYTHNVTLREQDNTAKFQIYSSGGGCVFYNAESNGAYYFYTNGTERMRITSGGDFHVGTTSNHGFHTINKSVAAGGLVFGISSPATGYWTALFGAVDQGSSNSAQTALFLRKRSSTGRSINAAGTINAGGNDYAEYMTKAVTDTIEKGDIVGINSSGLLTNVFSESISFVIKSTDPSYVGGDSWGNDLNETDLEIERAKVDRIAFSGQVPCNVTGASVGDYIIPVSSSDGKITGQAVSNPTFEQYKISVGKVWKIMNNGNSWVAVKIG